jgi:multisubunit Na+/H+ antiporter MnhG subunit
MAGRIWFFAAFFLTTLLIALGLILVPEVFTRMETFGLRVLVVVGCVACAVLILHPNPLNPKPKAIVVLRKG